MNDGAETPFPILDRSDERGFSFQLDDLPLEHFHIVSMKPGSVRGDHAHGFTEVICVIGGKGCAEIELAFEHGLRKITVERDFHPVTVPPGVKHTVRNVGGKEFFLVCFAMVDGGQ